MIPLPTWPEIQRLLPEIWLTVGMMAVLIGAFFRRSSHAAPAGLAILSLLLAIASVLPTLTMPAETIFSDLLAIDPFSQFFKLLLLAFTTLVAVQWLITAREKSDPLDSPDFFCLILGATAGMALMASANHLLMLVVAIETASLPSYALAGYRKRTRSGSEAAMKYVVFGAASSALMIYGSSLLYAQAGTLDLPTIAAEAGRLWSTTSAAALTTSQGPLLALGVVFLLAGIAFKLSAVPMHFWCPDVFQAAPTAITTFLSVASKGAAVVLLVRVLYTFGILAPHDASAHGLAIGVALLGAVTATWGNLLALRQSNIKRLLAYSSIAHAGYIIMAASLLAVAGSVIDRGQVVGAVLFYLTVYLFMNLGAFTVAALIERPAGRTDLPVYAGLISRQPALAVAMSVFLLSLFGLPALGGFMAKIQIAVSMTKLGVCGFGLIAILLINTLLSLYFYLKPVYHMIFLPATEKPAINERGLSASSVLVASFILALCVAALVWTGLGGGINLTRDYATLMVPHPQAIVASATAVTP